MLEFLAATDRSLFLILNGLNAPWLDVVMFWITKTLVWIPFYVLLLWMVFRKYGKDTLWILLFVALMITAGDQLCNLVKDATLRLRPSQDPTLGAVHTVNGYKGGMYGFYSAHASNTFALAVFLVMLLRKEYRWIASLLIPWAFVISYSRVYLGIHYPGDILLGMIAGSLLGMAFGKAYNHLFPERTRKSGVSP